MTYKQEARPPRRWPRRLIAAVLAEKDTEKAADALIELALNNGGRDNVSVILLDFEAEER